MTERLSPKLPPASLEGRNLWIHALSVGEVISAVPLVKALKLKYPDKKIVFTVTTSKGMDIAQKELKDDVHILLPMPVDFWWCIRRMVSYIRPSIFILVETDIWPGILDYLRRKNITSLLVNGRVSPRTFKSYSRFPALTRMMFRPLDFCLMQSDLDRKRLLMTGLEPIRVRTIGNIKFDRDWVPMKSQERHDLLHDLGFEPEDAIWVAGSTHPGEEETVLKVLKKLRRSFPRVRLVVAPRAIERSGDILRLAKSMGLECALKSRLSEKTSPGDVLVLDTLGELGRIYGIGKVSFVGGSLVPFGGHNLLEPASFGCPVLFGPHTHNFVLMSELLEESGGGWRVQDGEALYRAMEKLLGDEEKLEHMGRLAKELTEKNRGALDRVLELVADHV